MRYKAKLFGITLVEIMVASILSSLVLGAGYKIWSNAKRDVALATTRQKLASQVRIALDRMTRDLQAAKAGTLEINANNDGTSAIIKFEKYLSETDSSKVGGNKTEKITYRYQKPILSRSVDGQSERILASNLEVLQIVKGVNNTPNSTPAPTQLDSSQARLDIYMEASSYVPGSHKIASFTSQVSVFIRDEYKNILEDSRYVSISKLIESDISKLQDQNKDDSRLNTGGLLDTETLAKLPKSELTELKKQQEDALKETDHKINEINDNIQGIDTKTNSKFSIKLWELIPWPTELTSIQKSLANSTKTEQIDRDIQKLNEILQKYEEQNLKETYAKSIPNFNSLDKKSEEYKILKDVYELKLRDRNFQKAHETAQKDKPENEKKPYRSVFEDFNPANLVKGQVIDADGKVINFTESDAEFAERKARAEKIYQYKDKADLSWMDSSEGEERVKLYSAAKDLKDLAEAKKALLELKETHAQNLENIKKYL